MTPCPPGYQVGDNTVFTGFTTHGGNAKFPYDWYDVLESNMLSDYYSGSSVNRQVLELYTDTRKNSIHHRPCHRLPRL